MASSRLVDALDRIDPLPYRGEAFRHLAPRWHPLSGAGARIQGGRWNPPESFATLYLALERETAAAEFRRMAARIGRRPADVFLRAGSIATASTCGRSSTSPASGRSCPSRWPGSTSRPPIRMPLRRWGRAAVLLGREAIWAPSATGRGAVLAIFIDCLLPDSTVESLGFETWESPPP